MPKQSAAQSERNPCTASAFFRIMKERFPEKLLLLQSASASPRGNNHNDSSSRSDAAVVVCCPRLDGDVCDVSEAFVDLHVLVEHKDEGWFKSRHSYLDEGTGQQESCSLIAERQGDFLKVLSAPGYHPSFSRGLYSARITGTELGVNKSFQQFKMFALDRPLIPKYTRASLDSLAMTPQSTVSSTVSSASNSQAPSTTTSRVSSSSSTRGRPYATNTPQINRKDAAHRMDEVTALAMRLKKAAAASSHAKAATVTVTTTRKTNDRRVSVSSTGSGRSHSLRQAKSGPTNPPVIMVVVTRPQRSNASKNATQITTVGSTTSSSRQCSADSGIEVDASLASSSESDAKYILPPRITSYAESEGYLMSLPRCDQFVTHLARNLRPMMEELRYEVAKFTSAAKAKDQIHKFAPRLYKLTQELVIAFPRSASLVNNSPRFQEFLRLAVENVVMRFVHDRIFPVICHLSKAEDRELSTSAGFLHASGLSTDQLGLSEDFCVPLPAAVVELSSLDMRTTPLDRLTCIYDTLQQIGVHIREAVLEARADANNDDIPDDLPFPNDHDMVLLLASVLVQARPRHLMSTLNYADLFAWTVPIDMIEAVSLMSSAADFVRHVQPASLLPSSGKLKREVSMEEIIQLTDEVQQVYDRHGHRLEPLRSALDLHRERFALKLERSSADRTRRQEEAWARLDRCPTPETIATNRQIISASFARGLLATIHTKLLCSSNPGDVVETKK